jgi:hypothetical protein
VPIGITVAAYSGDAPVFDFLRFGFVALSLQHSILQWTGIPIGAPTPTDLPARLPAMRDCLGMIGLP